MIAAALRRRGWFGVVVGICVFFFVMTVAAMLVYPGGSVASPESESYSFFLNFFSDLGQTHVGYGSGASNLTSMVLFAIALIVTSCGLALFFVNFAGLYERSRTAVWLSRIAAVFGILSGICFVGVALTPWNLYLQAHNQFVFGAFRSFLVAVVLLIGASVVEPGVPRRIVAVFSAFALLLAAYVVLLAFGPPLSTPVGSMVQATGQKVIAYASILTVMIQSLNARSWLTSSARAGRS